MDEVPWFEYEEDDLDVAQRAFVDVLAERAGSWLVDPLDTVVLPSAHTYDGQLIVYLDIGDPQRNQGVLTVGTHFDGFVVRGGALHNQDFTVRQAASEFVFGAAGSPTELGNRVAEWFEAVLARPLVRCEWHHEGRMYAVRYEYADTGRGLCEGFETLLAPDALRKRLAADGMIRGRGRINRAGLGQPDAVAHIRGVHPDQ
ncbi:hypothetical protein GCM10010329_84820 [Streptomyces spiroverticillatus]|uniref:Uncharacterized protein n=1 Tax=Streptomyces finlayi TaxID=67296 RepID=A0A918XAB2_9ACTN|nr:hypothetical protein [Streptomyces finlayi]GHA49647.1 hypothetical protein GCM10010329_84820 [Streptomyces spiroverticillatus]GHD19438.1 hypothetical protein GCM10010334_83130 [Streptomyces finlayi]